jgi:DNA modification methylase
MFQKERVEISEKFDPRKKIVLYQGDCLKLLRDIPDESLQLIVTSPPYNIGKEYERKLKLSQYIEQQAAVIKECVRAYG